MKRILTLALAVMLALSLTAFAETDSSTWLCEEKTTLTVCTYDGVSQAFPTIGNDLEFWQWLEDYTNVHIEWEVHSNADYTTVKTAKLAAGVIESDIINLGYAMCTEAGKSGLLIDMTPYIETCMPHTVAYAENENPHVLRNAKTPEGKMYGMGGSVSPDIGHICYMYNVHFLEKIGAEMPETIDEFTELCRRLKAAGDLNENGEDDEIILATASFNRLDIMGNSFGLEAYEGTSGFAAKDGVVYSEYIADETKEYWQYLNILFEEGILDPGVATTSADKLSQAIASDKVAIFVYYSGFSTAYGNLTSWGQADPLACHYSMGGPLEGPDGHKYYVRRDRDINDVTGVSSTCSNPELAIRWLDTMISDPVVLATRTTGLEGVHHYIDENGDKHVIMPEDGSAWSIKPFGGGQIAMPHYQTYDHMMFSRVDQYPWYIEQYNDFLDEFITASVIPTSNYTQEEQELIDLAQSDVKAYFGEMRAKFVTGEVSFDEWDNYVDNMYGLGLQDWVDAMQMYYDRTKA